MAEPILLGISAILIIWRGHGDRRGRRGCGDRQGCGERRGCGECGKLVL